MNAGTTVLRGYIHMMIMDVVDKGDGTVLVLGPPARLGRRRLLIKGPIEVVELRERTIPRPRYDDDDDLAGQAQVDIGDDLYEQNRYRDDDER